MPFSTGWCFISKILIFKKLHFYAICNFALTCVCEGNMNLNVKNKDRRALSSMFNNLLTHEFSIKTLSENSLPPGPLDI